MSGRAAVFLDRDGTLVDDPGFLRDPERVRLLPGAIDAVRRLNATGMAVVVVTNQSGIGRGLISEVEYQEVAQRFRGLLEAGGARLDGQYHCPHAPDAESSCECRKPGTLLFRRAAADLGLELSRSWWVGDRLSDVEPARAFGGRGILVRTGDGPSAPPDGWTLVNDVAEAVRYIVGEPSHS